MSLVQRDVTKSMVEALEQDIKRSSDFHEGHWELLKSAYPGMCSFIEVRLKEMLIQDNDPVHISLALIVELSTFSDQQNFNEIMIQDIELPTNLQTLGNKSLTQQKQIVEQWSGTVA